MPKKKKIVGLTDSTWNDHLADCVDLDEADEEEWNLMACSMGRDGQCGQAGTEFCDFECPIMASMRRENAMRRVKRK